MSETAGQKFLIRDARGNVYGPADPAMLLEWVQQGRIVPGMSIAPRETREWIETSQHPLLAEALQRRAEELRQTPADPYAVQPASAETHTYEQPQEPAPTTYDVTPEPSNPYAQTASPVPGSLATTRTSELQYDSAPPQQNKIGTIGFVFGLVSIVGMLGSCVPYCGCVALPIGALCALTAIVLSTIGLYQIRADPNAYTGRGLALAGLIMGIIPLVLFVVGVILVMVFAVAMPGRP